MKEKETNFKESKFIEFFRFRGLTSFPFIEDTFDAINDYQLLSKVVEYLNKVIAEQNLTSENMKELIKLYEELKTYVDTYFDSLELQEEINIKLDMMVEDGTLSRIINEEIFNDLNTKIDDLSNELINNTLFVPKAISDGGAESINLLRLKNENILFDTGRETSVAHNYNYLLSKLDSTKINKIVISHYHYDHMGGLEGLKDLYSDDLIVYLPLNFTNYYNGEDKDLLITIREQVIFFLTTNNINYIEIDKDTEIQIDNAKLKLFNSTSNAYSYYSSKNSVYNSYSMNAIVDIKGNKILFPGDSLVDTQDYLISVNQVEKVNIFVVNHHGYERIANNKYFDIINPDIMIYSISKYSWSIIDTIDYDYTNINDSKKLYCDNNDVIINVSNFNNLIVKGNFARNSLFPNFKRDVYVDSNFTGDSDGSINAPFKKISEVLDLMQDTSLELSITLKSGIYENIRLFNVVNTLILKSDDKVEINNIQIVNCTAIYFNNLTLTDVVTNYSNIYMNDVILKASDTSVGSSAIEISRGKLFITNSTVENNYTGIYANNGADVSVNNTSFDSVSNVVFAYTSNINLKDYTIINGFLRRDEGSMIQCITAGSTANRPLFNNSNNMRGYLYFDTSIGLPIFYYNNDGVDKWINANGDVV